MALSQIPNPMVGSWRDFVDTLIGFNPSLRPNLSPDEPWQELAVRLTQFEPLAPRPEAFKDWREWACALKQAYPD